MKPLLNLGATVEFVCLEDTYYLYLCTDCKATLDITLFQKVDQDVRFAMLSIPEMSMRNGFEGYSTVPVLTYEREESSVADMKLLILDSDLTCQVQF